MPALQRAADEQQLPVTVHAVPWIAPDTAYLMAPMPPLRWEPGLGVDCNGEHAEGSDGDRQAMLATA